ncbi:GDP-mannose 4,6-dehydratase [soil metagenome]
MANGPPRPIVVVTGGVGFIGFHLTRALILAGNTVRVVDDLSDAPYPRVWKERNAADLTRELGDHFSLTVACVTDRAAQLPVYRGAESVIHLAGLAGVRPSFRDPARYAKVNVEGTATTLELAREVSAKRYLFASSSSVYGNSTPLPAHEDAPAVVPESPYAASKRSAELVAASVARIAPGLPITALRFFTVYGPRQRPEMAITLFTRAILEGRAITVFCDGSMRRDFTHVSDIVRGIALAKDRAPAGFRAYNLGSGSPIGLGELVTRIGETCGKTPTITRADVPPGDVDATFADIARANRELGWKPSVALDVGLASVRDWVASNP